jgi:hypothetical protein
VAREEQSSQYEIAATFRDRWGRDLKSNIQVLQKRRVSRKSESDSGAGGKKKARILFATGLVVIRPRAAFQ